MKLNALFSLAVMIASLSTGSAQSPQMQSPQYDVAEAYEVYAALLQGYWQGVQQKTVVISTTTKFWKACANPATELDKGLKSALEQYNAVNKDAWELQSEFGFGRQFEFISHGELASMFQKGLGRGWESFAKRYPDSSGFVELSAVGFNEDKSIAVVYMGYHCGGMCGRGGVKFLHKKDGHWLHMSERESALSGSLELRGNWRNIAISLIESASPVESARGGFNEEARWCGADVEKRA